MIATKTSRSTKAPTTSATFCRLNLRQNTDHGVRTASAVATAFGSGGSGSCATSTRSGVESMSAVTDRRVDEPVQHVDDQVDEDELEREQEHERLDRRIVPHVDGVDEQSAEPRPVEYLL